MTAALSQVLQQVSSKQPQFRVTEIPALQRTDSGAVVGDVTARDISTQLAKITEEKFERIAPQVTERASKAVR